MRPLVDLVLGLLGRGEPSAAGSTPQTVYVASRVLVRMAMGSSRRPDGHSLDELLVSGYPQDYGIPLAPPAQFASAMNFLFATGDVLEKDGRFLPSSTARDLVDRLYPKVGLGDPLVHQVRAYLEGRKRSGAGPRFRPDDPEMRAAYAAFAERFPLRESR